MAVGVQAPITGHVIEVAASLSAVDTFTFQAFYRLESLRAQTQLLRDRGDCLISPTTPTIYRIDAVEAEPICLNTQPGMYTNFVNLLDLAVPSGCRVSGPPTSIPLTAPASHDDLLTSIAPAFQRRAGPRLGAITHKAPFSACIPRIAGVQVTQSQWGFSSGCQIWPLPGRRAGPRLRADPQYTRMCLEFL